MATLREREDALVELIRRHDHFTGDAIRDIVRLHLLGACEEAVREDRERYNMQNSAKVYRPLNSAKTAEATNYNDPGNTTPSNQPTVEDALKAVLALCKKLLFVLDEDDMRAIYRGCVDILNGHRDTPAAKAITGEGNGGQQNGCK